MRKLFLIIACVSLAACGSKDEGQKVPPPSSNDKAGLGPFIADFSNSLTYSHSFKIAVSQPEGGVDYLITTATNGTVELTKAQLMVTGCPVSQVTHQVFWKPDMKINQGHYIGEASVFNTVAGVQGSVTHLLYGLSGCSHVELQTVLTKK